MGVALSDPAGVLATPLVTLAHDEAGTDLGRLVALVDEHEVVVPELADEDRLLGLREQALQRGSLGVVERVRVVVERRAGAGGDTLVVTDVVGEPLRADVQAHGGVDGLAVEVGQVHAVGRCPVEAGGKPRAERKRSQRSRSFSATSRLRTLIGGGAGHSFEC